MTKNRLLVIVNLLLAILIISQLSTVILMKVVGYKGIVEIHAIIGSLIFILITMHVILNWVWIKKNIFKLS